MFLYLWRCPGSPFFCQCLSGFLPYSQDSGMCCLLQPYLQKPKYFDLCNYTYILLVLKCCRFRASCLTSDLKKRTLFSSSHFVIFMSFLVMFLTTLSAKYAKFFACCRCLFSCLMKHVWVDVSSVYEFSSLNLCN